MWKVVFAVKVKKVKLPNHQDSGCNSFIWSQAIAVPCKVFAGRQHNPNM